MSWVSVGSDNGVSPVRYQAITWNNAKLLPIGPLGTNLNEFRIKIRYIGGHFVQWGWELKRPHCSRVFYHRLVIGCKAFVQKYEYIRYLYWIIRSFLTDLERCHLVLKSCFYTYDPEAVLEVFPDACLIFTRRNLRDALGSMMLLLKMVCNVRVCDIFQK